MGSLISGILGGGESDAQAGQQAALQQAADAAHAYRPEAMQARLNLLNNASGAYQGMNNAMETMYGGRGPSAGSRMRDAVPHSPDTWMAGKSPPTFGGHPVPQGPGETIGGAAASATSAPVQGGNQPRPLLSQVFDPAGVFKSLF